MIKNEFKLRLEIEINHGFKESVKINKKVYIKTWPKDKFIKFDKKINAYVLKDSIKNQETFNFLNKCKLSFIRKGFKGFSFEKIANALNLLCDDELTTSEHALLKIHVTFEFPKISEKVGEKIRVEEIDVFVKIRELIHLLQNEYLLKNEKEFVKKHDLKKKLKLKKTPDKIIVVEK